MEILYFILIIEGGGCSLRGQILKIEWGNLYSFLKPNVKILFLQILEIASLLEKIIIFNSMLEHDFKFRLA